MADFPVQGFNEDTWGTELIAFFKKAFHMSGDNGGLLAIVCNQNQVVCNQNKVVTNIDRSIQ
jgi:hypothetical protein